MKKNDYTDKIQEFLATRTKQPIRARKLARLMGVSDDEYRAFRQAIKTLRESGRLVMGAKNALTLPLAASQYTGFFHANPKGFGFVVPKEPNIRKDLYIPIGQTGGAITGDLVVARVVKKGKRQGKMLTSGQVVKILKRGLSQCVGTLEQTKGTWFVLPDGKKMTQPIVIPEDSTAGAPPGSKVVVALKPAEANWDLPWGEIVEVLGPQGSLETETLAVIRQYDLPETFSDEALAQARKAAAQFAPGKGDARTDLTHLTVVTIDPDDARDFDDAISVVENADKTLTLGVHIADVSAFVPRHTPLDAQAKSRGTSVYLPRMVVPMLPEVLSNGVCSLKQDEPRYTKTAFITYDRQGQVLERTVCESIIRSCKRLTYTEAQRIADGDADGFPDRVVKLVRRMDALARKIETRRRATGQLHLNLPEVELVFDADNRVVDARREDSCYTHTIIEMFMVEANEAVASLFRELGVPIIRRIHPEPNDEGFDQLVTFLRACGHKLPSKPSQSDLQALIQKVENQPEGYAVNLAVLRSFQQATYSIAPEQHYALASSDYCHFTSPIRRYPDLTVHRMLTSHLRGELTEPDEAASEALSELAAHCTATERQAAAAEIELRQVLILLHLKTKLGHEFEGVITGIADFGIFVQFPRFLIDGLLRFKDLGDDWWDVQARYGLVRGERTGKTFRIGDVVQTCITGVDIAKRQLEISYVGKKAEPPKQRADHKRARHKKHRS